MRYDLLTHDMYQMFLGASILTMTFSPFLISHGDAIGQSIQKLFRLPDLMPYTATKLSQLLHQEQQSVQPKKKWDGHTIIIGFGTTGEYLSNVITEIGIQMIICELIYDRYRKAKTQFPLTVFGDASSPVIAEKIHVSTAKLMIISTSNKDVAIRIIKSTRAINPKINIIVRTRRMEDIEMLHNLGADIIIPEELETTIEILALALRQYRIPRNVIASQLAVIRHDHYKPFLGKPVSDATLNELPYLLSASTTESGILLDHSPVIGKTLEEIELVKVTGIKIIAIVRDGKPTHQPPLDYRLQKGDIIILLGSHAEVDAALGMIGCEIVS
jgi:monovalent cation:H+ antiporter-2, CPA2 family